MVCLLLAYGFQMISPMGLLRFPVVPRVPYAFPMDSLCVPMALLWFYYGLAMVPLWIYYGCAMGDAMDLLWVSYGITMVFLWICYGVALDLL